MTEYEMASLLAELQTTMQIIYGTLIALVSGFLIASHYVAHRLTIFMVVVVVGLYTLFLGWNGMTLSAMSISFGGLMEHMHTFAADGKHLQWHVVASPNFFVLPIRLPILLVFVVLYLSTVTYFFHCRQVNRKAERASNEQPKAN